MIIRTNSPIVFLDLALKSNEVNAFQAEVVVEEPSVPTTEEVVETVQSILTSDTPVTTKTTEERLDALIELLKSTSKQIEYDDNKYRWTGPLVSIREALENL